MTPRSSILSALAALPAVLALAPAASAATTTSTLLPAQDAACAAAPTSKPFLSFGDVADYVPAPSGSFEAGLGSWTAKGAATIVADNEPWLVGGADHSRALALKNGAAVASAPFCGGVEYPTIRLFARSVAPTGLLRVDVRYTGGDGVLRTLPLGTLTVGRDWSPTAITLTASGVPLLTGTKLGMTLTSVAGDVVVDDVYVDPWRRS